MKILSPIYRFLVRSGILVFLVVILASVVWYADQHDGTKIVDYRIRGNIVDYAYVGDPLPEKIVDNEVPSLRDDSSYTVRLADNEQGQTVYKLHSYASQRFVNDGTGWKNIVYTSTTTKAFTLLKEGSVVGRIARAIIAPAYATDITAFAESGDDCVSGGGSPDYNTVRNLATGVGLCSDEDSTTLGAASGFEVTNFYINRVFMSFSTATIPSSATISAASVTIFVNATTDDDNDARGYITVVQSTHAAATVALADFDAIGSTEGIDSGQRKDLTGLSGSQTFTLNATGRAWVNKGNAASACTGSTGKTCIAIREGHDFENDPLTHGALSVEDATFDSSTGTNPPSLSVTYSTGGTLLVKPANNLGLVGYWPMNEGTSTRAGDFSGFGNNGLLTNSPAWTNGKFGQALSFNGAGSANSYVAISDSAQVVTTDDWTASVWVYVRSVPGAAHNYFFLNGDDNGGATSGFNMVARVTAPIGNGMVDVVTGTNSDTELNTLSVLPTNTWVHFAVTKSGTALQLYINGVADNSTTLPSATMDTTSDQTATRIGSSATATGIPDASIDDVRVYNRALTASQISALYKNGTAGATRVNASSVALQNGTTLGNGLVGLWTFDGGDTRWTSETAGVVYDRSTSNNTATFTNMSRSLAQAIGKLGQGLAFDGVDDNVTVNTSTNLSVTGSLSIAAWVYANTLTNSYAFLVSKRDLAGGPDTYSFEMDAIDTTCNSTPGTYRPALWWTSAGGFIGFLSNTTASTGVWQHWVLVRNTSNSTVQIYLNGVSVGATSSVGCPGGFGFVGDPADATTNNVLFGDVNYDDGGTVDPFKGRLDDVRIYNRALTAAEAKQLYLLGTAKTNK